MEKNKVLMELGFKTGPSTDHYEYIYKIDKERRLYLTSFGEESVTLFLCKYGVLHRKNEKIHLGPTDTVCIWNGYTDGELSIDQLKAIIYAFPGQRTKHIANFIEDRMTTIPAQGDTEPMDAYDCGIYEIASMMIDFFTELDEDLPNHIVIEIIKEFKKAKLIRL